MSNQLAILYLLKFTKASDSDKWLSVKDVAKEINLSIDRTRKHLSLLVYADELETRVDGWKNVYRCKR